MMTISKTDAYQALILTALQTAEWKLVRLETEEEWYAFVHLIVKSERQAYGLEVVVSFMVDPMEKHERSLSHILAGTRKPTQMRDAETFAEMWVARSGFEDRMKKFIKDINEFRNLQHMAVRNENRNGTRNTTWI